MPRTNDGSGTTYLGKWNHQTQDRECESCHQRVSLVSFETWQCACVLSIPLIPLGKKQVLDYCPRCQKHRVMPHRDWVRVQEQWIAESSAELPALPDDPDKSIRAHSAFDSLQKHEEATQLAELMEASFCDLASVQFYLAAWYERTGRASIAHRLFLRAFELEPQDIRHRRGALLTFIGMGNVDQARSMLAPFLPGTEHFEVLLFTTLAGGFQKQGRHQEALQTMQLALDAVPDLSQDKAFQRVMATSEKVLGIKSKRTAAESVWNSSTVKGVAVIAASVAIGVFWNLYIAFNRTVTLVNGLPTEISVRVDGNKDVLIGANGQSDVTLAEGQHHVEVIAPADQFPKVVFELSSDWWERFSRRPAFVVDPTKSAVLLWEEATYAGANQVAPELRLEIRLGETFTSYKHIDYRFAEFPESVKSEKKTPATVRTRLTVLHENIADIIDQARSMGKSPGALLSFLQTHLQYAPDRGDLLAVFASLSLMADKVADCRNFLRGRLADRPVRVEWHRVYQSLSGHGLAPDAARRQHEQLKQEYDTASQAEPDNASLYYLRGRLEGHGRRSDVYFERALSIEPGHPYALFASSNNQLMQGEFATALQLLKKAIAARPGDYYFQQNLVRTRLAARDLAGLEADAREELARQPLNMAAMKILLKALVHANRHEEAHRELDSFTQKYQQIYPGRFHGLLEPLSLMLISIEGDFELLEQEAAKSTDPGARIYTWIAGLESNRLVDLSSGEAEMPDLPYFYLCRELVARNQNNGEAAGQSRDAALTLLDRGNEDDWAVADVLRQAESLDWDNIADVHCDPAHKAVVLVVLAQERAELRNQMLELAEKLNFDLEFPHFLLDQMIAELRIHQ